MILPNATYRHKNGAAPASSHHGAFRVTLTEHGAAGFGGTGCALGGVSLLDPDMANRARVFDADRKTTTDLPSGTVILLNNDGVFGKVLANRDHYSYLRGDGLPPYLTAWETDQGLGMMRIHAAVLVGYHLDSLKARIHQELKGLFQGFRGSGSAPKEMVIHFVFSLAGGAGSALCIPLAMLYVDGVRSISASIRISTVAHVIGPEVFTGLLPTPVEIERGRANSGIGMRELTVCQDPRATGKLATALNTRPLTQPLFSHIFVYDLVDSGEGLQSLDDIYAAMAANVVAGRCQELHVLEQARDANPGAAQRGAGLDEHGTAVLGSCRSMVARVPVSKLAVLRGARAKIEQIDLANRPAQPEQVEEQTRDALAGLALRKELHRLEDGLEPDKTYHLPALAGLTNTEVGLVTSQALRRWEQRGRADLVRRRKLLATGLPRQARDRAAACWQKVVEDGSGVPEIAASAANIVIKIQEQLESAAAELKLLANSAVQDNLQKALVEIRRPRRWWQGSKKSRRELASAFGHLQETERRVASLELWSQEVLAPMLEFFQAEQEQAESLELLLRRLRAHTIDEELPGARQALGVQTPFVTEVISADEVPALEAKIVQAVPVTHSLNLTKLLTAGGDDKVEALIEDTSAQVRHDLVRHLARFNPDIGHFVEAFGLGFDLFHWLEQQFHELTLPAKLDLSQRGPGQTPLKGYIVAAPSARSTIDQAAKRIGTSVPYEFLAGEDPLTIIMRWKIVRAPFASFPKLDLIEAAYQNFRKENPPGTTWSVLESSGLLAPAHEVNLTGTAAGE